MQREAQAEPADEDVARSLDLGERGRGELPLGGRLVRVHHEHAVDAKLQHRRRRGLVRVAPLPQHHLAALGLRPRHLDVLHTSPFPPTRVKFPPTREIFTVDPGPAAQPRLATLPRPTGTLPRLDGNFARLDVRPSPRSGCGW